MKDYIKRICENEDIHGQTKKVICDEIYHGIEVSNLAAMIAKELGEDDAFINDLTVAGVLHDIGKLQLADYLFPKGDTLVIEQIKYMRIHSEYSYRILRAEGYPDNILKAVYYHHENCNGTGYPDSLHGSDIPWMARILRTCDVFAALTSDRSYRKAFDASTAMEIMIDEIMDYDMEVFLAFQRTLHNGRFKGLESLRSTISPLQMSQLALFEKEAMRM